MEATPFEYLGRATHISPMGSRSVVTLLPNVA